MIGQEIKYSYIDIIKLLSMEIMLGNVWYIEDGIEPKLHQILIAIVLLNNGGNYGI